MKSTESEETAPMHYYKYADEDGMKNGFTYIKVEDGWALRMITVGSEPSIASNINNPGNGPVLAEGELNLDDVDTDEFEITPISKEEFDAVWNHHLAQHQPQWEAAKARYPVGTPVLGVMLIFYPQGVLIDLGPDTLGVADYEQCRTSAPPEWMYPKHKIRAIVAGYDEGNQWITLREPQVLEERAKAKRR